jgi:hypothetical protein
MMKVGPHEDQASTPVQNQTMAKKAIGTYYKSQRKRSFTFKFRKVDLRRKIG